MSNITQRQHKPAPDLEFFLHVQRGMPLVIPRDDAFAFVTPDYVRGPFADYFLADLRARKFIYRPNSRDCDKFTRHAAALMAEANAQTEEAADYDTYAGLGIAFGEVFLPTRGHALNIGIHVNATGGLEDWYYEPQPSLKGGQIIKVSFNVVEVSPEEKRKANLCLLG